MYRLIWAVAVALLLAAAAMATPISTLCNTGANVNGSFVDQCYTITSPSSASAYQVATGGWPFTNALGQPLWVANPVGAAWIAPQHTYTQTAGSGDPAGNYVFRTTFTLPDIANLNQTQITGFWAADNSGVEIYINGMPTGNSIPGGDLSAFNTLHAFTINSGFLRGTNVLEFHINNLPSGCCNPVGLLVQMSGTFEPVPEPATWLLLGVGLAGLGLIRRRR